MAKGQPQSVNSINERYIKTTVGQIFDLVKKAKNKKERVDILTKYKDNIGLQTILRLQYDSRFIFDLPEGVPADLEENKTESGLGEVTLLSNVKNFHYFLKGSSKTDITRLRREQMFMDLLVSLDKEESQILIDVKDKKLDFGLTRKLVDEVFPNLIPANVPKKNEKERKDDSSNNTNI